jgi:RNA polymerase subunit RPABC4/transcription elongation factor Spt4
MSRTKKSPAPKATAEPDTQSIFYMLEHGEPAPAPVRQLDLFAGVACDVDACPPTQRQCVQCGALFTAGGGFCPKCVADYRRNAPKREPPSMGDVDELSQFNCERCGYVETGAGPLCRGCEREDEGKEAAE